MSATVTTRRTIRVHAAERSTDQDLLRPYVWTMTWLVAAIATVAVAWVAAAPSPVADLPTSSTAPAVESQAGTTAEPVSREPFSPWDL